MAGVYRVHEFAELAGVTVRTLHHYDRVGVLKPRRGESGYRLYSEQDLARLEQVVALKFLGLPLGQIKTLLDREVLRLPEALRAQRFVLEEKRRMLDRAIKAIETAEDAIEPGKPVGAAALRTIIEVLGMQLETHDSTDFMKNYCREQAWADFRTRHGSWPGEDWRRLFREVQQALGSDSGSAQELAAKWRALRASDSAGDPGIHEALIRAWADRTYWPSEVQARFAEFDLDEISRFIAAAFSAYRRKHFGDIVWVSAQESFAEEDRERFPLAVTDLYFKIATALEEDPSGPTGQALAARWMELIESRTGGVPREATSMGSAVRWMDGWPPELHRKIRALPMERITAFILRAIRQRQVARTRTGME